MNLFCYHVSPRFKELVALEYVLTWGYTKNEKRDERRYMYLSRKFWNRRLKNQYKRQQQKQ